MRRSVIPRTLPLCLDVAVHGKTECAMLIRGVAFGIVLERNNVPDSAAPSNNADVQTGVSFSHWDPYVPRQEPINFFQLQLSCLPARRH